MKIAILPGDGIGPKSSRRRCGAGRARRAVRDWKRAEWAAPATPRTATRCPTATLQAGQGRRRGAVRRGRRLQVRHARRALRPEQAILGLRKELGLFANLRPAILYPELADASTLKPEVVSGLDILIIRELTGDIYFGQPRGVRECPDGPFKGEREGFDTMRYTEGEIRRIAHVAFQAARKRGKRVTASTRPTCSRPASSGAMSSPTCTRNTRTSNSTTCTSTTPPCSWCARRSNSTCIVTGNMFGDILSDDASMLTGSIGMLPSASLDANNKGLYEPSHGSAPDIAGKGVANPLATILSAAMMLRYYASA